MKAKLIIAASLFLAYVISAQNIEIPKEVKETFVKKYPNITDVKWSKEGDEEFEAEFFLNGVKTSVVIDEDGEVEETEYSISIHDLSKNIIKYVNDNYAGYEITEAAKITDEDGNVFYEAEVTKGKTSKDLLFDTKGNIVKKQKESENEDNDED